MLSRDHLLVNIGVGSLLVAGPVRVLHEAGLGQAWAVRLERVMDVALGWLCAPWPAGGGWTPAWPWTALGAAAAFLLGTVAPDVDNPRSLVGRHFRWLPLGPHGGLTHSLWVLIGLAAVVVLVPVARPLTASLWLGWALHVLVDRPSRSGWAPWWPLNLGRHRWRIVDMGGVDVVVVDGGARLYRVGSGLETALALLSSAVTGSLAVWLALPVLRGA